jgi:uncharacterized protein DUF2637
MTDRLIRVTTALAVAAVAAVAAVISYRHAYELVSTHGETGVTARLVPFTVDGLILAASMLILDASRRQRPVPPLARWCLGAGIAATIGANLAHGLGHGPIGALGQRMARPGSGWLLRVAHDARENRPRRTHSNECLRARAPARTGAGAPRATRAAAGTEPGADGPGLARGWSQPAGHSPRAQHRPSQGEAHHRPGSVTERGPGHGRPEAASPGGLRPGRSGPAGDSRVSLPLRELPDTAPVLTGWPEGTLGTIEA